MTNYTKDSSILGTGTVSASAIDRWFASRGPDYRNYAPDGQYRSAPADLGQAIVDECRRYAGYIVNHDLAAGQILHETAAWQSRYARERNNPGGIGAINSNPDLAVFFPTTAAGVRAHVAHLLVYAVGDGPWSKDDPRRDAVADQEWLGAAPTLVGLNGRWAWPGTVYGTQIANHANGLIEFARANADPPVGRIPRPAMRTDRVTPNHSGYDEPRIAEAISNHISDGSLEGDLNHLTRQGSGAGSNYYIARGGTIYELAHWSKAAWTNGPWGDPDLSNPLIKSWFMAKLNPNTRTISKEFEGKPGDRLTPEQINASNHLDAWLSEQAGIPLDRTHYIGHYQIDNINRSYCPSFDEDEWQALLDGASAYLKTDDTVSKTRLFDVPGIGTIPVSQGFLAFYDKFGGLERDGWPLTGEIEEDGLVVQYFERSRYEWHYQSNPEKYDVMRGRVGAELLDARAEVRDLRLRVRELEEELAKR